MNGITSTLKDEIKKKSESKTKEKFKIILMLLTSNFFVFILCFTMFTNNQSEKEKGLDSKNQEQVLKPNHQWLIIPVQTLLVDENSPDNIMTPVSLFSMDKKLLTEKAYLHHLVKTESGLQYFKFEISSSDVKNFTDLSLNGVLVVPYVKNEELKKVASLKKIKKGSIYEVDY